MSLRKDSLPQIKWGKVSSDLHKEIQKEWKEICSEPNPIPNLIQRSERCHKRLVEKGLIDKAQPSKKTSDHIRQIIAKPEFQKLFCDYDKWINEMGNLKGDLRNHEEPLGNDRRSVAGTRIKQEDLETGIDIRRNRINAQIGKESQMEQESTHSLNETDSEFALSPIPKPQDNKRRGDHLESKRAKKV